MFVKSKKRLTVTLFHLSGWILIQENLGSGGQVFVKPS